jgi:hypothetical protein
MMSYFVTLLVKAFCFLVSAAFIFTVVVAQLLCSQIPSVGHQCSTADGNVWMVPVLLAPIGVPALIASVLILARAKR